VAGQKAGNGEGRTTQIPLQFDLSDPAQAKAWSVAQRKALPHGTRKHLLIAFLCAVDDYETMTGSELTPDMISGRLIATAFTGRFRVADQPIVDEEPESFDSAEIIIASAEKQSPEETAKRFLGGMGNLFG
jgi:hypothetical protein